MPWDLSIVTGDVGFGMENAGILSGRGRKRVVSDVGEALVDIVDGGNPKRMYTGEEERSS